MQFSFSTVYTTILTSNILIILTACLLRNRNILRKVGYSLIGIVTVMTVLRLLLPFEFAITQTVLFPKWLSFLISRFRHELFYIAEFKITPWVLLCVVWIFGTLRQLLCFVREILHAKKYLSLYGKEVTDEPLYADTFLDICRKTSYKISLRIIKLSGISAPMLYGYRTPYILLPNTLQLPRQQLYHVLSHEISHYMHGDMLLKYGVRILTILYWWNPACYILKRQVELLLEMRIDDSVTQMDEHSKQEYLECLYTIANYSIACSDFPTSLCVDFGAKNTGDLTKRFDLLMHSTDKSSKCLKIVVVLTAGLLFASSYLFIFEASYVSPEINETYITPSATDTYFIQNGTGTYDMYFRGIYLETITSLDGYSTEIPIYNSPEEIPNANRN